MLLYHEVKGTSKSVPPGVKHVITSSNLPAPKCAKLKERADTVYAASLLLPAEVRVLSHSRKEQDTKEKTELKCPEYQNPRNLWATMPTINFEEERRKSKNRRPQKEYTGTQVQHPVYLHWGGHRKRMQNLPMLAEDGDLNNDSPVFQQTLLCHHLHPPHWITEKLAQWQVREGVETRGLEEDQWGYSHLAERGSLEA